LKSGARLTALIVSLVVPACAYAGGTTRPYRPPLVQPADDATPGPDLYARDCAWCHGDDGGGTERAPDLVTGTNGPALTHFVLTTGRMPLDYAEQRMARAEPVYNVDEVSAIVDYVARLNQPGPTIPKVDVDSGDIGVGLELYQENCAACHSTTGIGGAMAPSRSDDLPERQAEDPSTIAPDLSSASAVETAEAMLTGPGTMPVFGPDTFDDAQVDSIVRYVLYVQHPDNRGGASIGRVGPVAEGMVGWLVGLGLLLVGIRLLGTKAGEV
jgi:ubiquinol-cytochrome c reductase cytochrome c subunit